VGLFGNTDADDTARGNFLVFQVLIGALVAFALALLLLPVFWVVVVGLAGMVTFVIVYGIAADQ
jgi:hypothetical protein